MYKHVLIPVDLNDGGFSDKALEAAIWHAEHSRQSSIYLMSYLGYICLW